MIDHRCDTPLACPQCGGADDLATIEQITGYAFCTVPETGEIDYAGETDVDWNSSTTVGIRCGGCRWHYEGDDWRDHLRPQDAGTATQEGAR